MEEGESSVYALVGNIPPNYHASDLRNYFSQFIETGGFVCFHFRHRPETKLVKNSGKPPHTSEATSSTSSVSDKRKRTMCCIVKVARNRIDELIAMYHGKHWLDDKGDTMSALCFISKIRITDSSNTSGSIASNSTSLNSSTSDTGQTQAKYMTREEQKAIRKSRPRQEFSKTDLADLIELKPPDIMLNGNVGTPTKVFLALIQACKLPPVVIKKLGLTFPKTRSNKIYGNVPFDYGDWEKLCEPLESQTVTTANGHILTPGGSEHCDNEQSLTESVTETSDVGTSISGTSLEPSTRKLGKKRIKIDKSLYAERLEENDQLVSESDSDDCEDWERHEALQDDAANAERNKQRVYEEELEVQWEKGGSGLVFYTDAQYWKEQEGDFDEQTADDWDVDMEIYTDPTGGDMDARDFMKMRAEQRRRKGVYDLELDPHHIGQFEKHTKGIGRKVLEQQGWKEGEGIGSWKIGMSQALENEGQTPGVRTGLGYTGEKLQRFGLTKRPSRDTRGSITTVYDNPKHSDPQEPLLRRQGTHHLKHHPHIVHPERPSQSKSVPT